MNTKLLYMPVNKATRDLVKGHIEQLDWNLKTITDDIARTSASLEKLETLRLELVQKRKELKCTLDTRTIDGGGINPVTSES